MIDPATRAEGEEYSAYCARRWGGDGWTRSLRAKGASVGARFGDWRTWPNTFHASRLMLLADEHGCGAACAEALYALCYEEGANVSTRETVALAARRAAVPGGEEHVMSDAKTDELREALRNPRGADGERISAVPHFVVDAGDGQRFGVSGAQDASYWRALLEHFAA